MQVKTLLSRDGQYCVDIFKRDDGFFGFVQMKHYTRSEGDYWAPLGTLRDNHGNGRGGRT